MTKMEISTLTLDEDLDQEDLEIIQALYSTPPCSDWNGQEYTQGRLLKDMIMDDGMDPPLSAGQTQQA